MKSTYNSCFWRGVSTIIIFDWCELIDEGSWAPLGQCPVWSGVMMAKVANVHDLNNSTTLNPISLIENAKDDGALLTSRRGFHQKLYRKFWSKTTQEGAINQSVARFCG